MAFIDLGDQFIALQEGRKQPADKMAAISAWSSRTSRRRERRFRRSGVEILPGPFLDFYDP